eukprot:CAMPEP_0179041544 /NCGR_PEP_ID=MMETSP0796-20121207/16210_1 /TAXON_ID=73915 /ORGANISM="Pyrodinium bahamense, Strain pbaha01" /LENGTH=841 /DNA_ID=CAMNT_0020737909 /DNA_START=55 /DNA_END=2581 /DNA_ORIENTATION=-
MAFSIAMLLLALGLLGPAVAQQAGTNKKEVHVPISFATCTKAAGCTSKSVSLTMDAQWRWLHDAHPNMYGNCLNGMNWDSKIAKDGLSGASFCALEGMDAQAYKGTYGVGAIPGGVNLNFKNGQSIGSRLYMMEDTNTYMMFKLLNKEFTIDVDVSSLECGLNGAVYFVEMEADGGRGKKGNNTAGAKYGTGYCDAQCPHDLKFIDGEANVHDWHLTKTGPIGHYGACCSEMDIWEANKFSTAYTAHPCKTTGPLKCEGDTPENECGDTPPDCKCCTPKRRHQSAKDCPCCGRYKGVCDKDGCDYNSYRLGDTKFYGEGPGFALDTSKPMTIVTQFLTSDNTDTGDLVEIRRLYVQNGKVIKNSKATNLGTFQGDSITDELCTAQKKAFDNPDDFGPKGGLKQMGKAIGRGMVLVLSLWDDMLTKMVWLDSTTPTDNPLYPATKPGVVRGPCKPEDGDPNKLRSQYPMAHVKYTNIMVGEIGSTYGPAAEKVKNLAATQPAEVPAAPLPASVAPAPASARVPGGDAGRDAAGHRAGPGGPGARYFGTGTAWHLDGPHAAGHPGHPGTGDHSAGHCSAIADPSTAANPGALAGARPAAGTCPVAGTCPAACTRAAASARTNGGAGGGSGSPVCCTAASDTNNPCSAQSCYPGSDMRTGFCVKDAASCQVCQGHWCPSGFGTPTAKPVANVVAPPVQAAMGGVAPAAASTATVAGGNPGCCSSAKNPAKPCESCFPGSDITSGWCVEKETQCTANCGGHWCPSGIKTISAFELPTSDGLSEALAAPPPRAVAALRSVHWVAAPLLLVSGFLGVNMVQRRLRQATALSPATRSELEPLGGTSTA